MAAPSTLQPTLQQIDELDALLKQMLTLPSAPSEPAEKSDSTDKEPETSYRTPMVSPGPVEAALPVIAPPAEPPSLNASVEMPSSMSPSVTARSVSTLPAAASETSVPGPSSRFSIRFSSNSTPAPAPASPARDSFWTRALCGLNRHFDQRLEKLGVYGRWLRQPVGRNCLGLMGIVALVAAAALLLRDLVDWSR